MNDLSLTSNDFDVTPRPVASVPAFPTPGAGAGATGNPGGILGAQFARIQSMMREPAVLRAMPLIGLAALVSLAAVVWILLSAPDQRALAERISDADKAAVAQVLDGAGISYAFDSGSGALTVAETQYHPARMALAAAGLPKSAPDGDSLLASLPMGASRAVEGEKLRMAREMDLARTIEAIGAVDAARVHLALDAPSAFLRTRNTPTASVMLTLAGNTAISDGQVQAIVHLVASSVPGMAADAVSVVDQSGKLLSANGRDSASEKNVRVQQDIEDRYRTAISALLTPIVGVGNFSAEVNADLQFSEKQSTRESYPADDARVAREQGSWNADGGGASGGGYGVPGALSNQAPQAAVPGSAPVQIGAPPSGSLQSGPLQSGPLQSGGAVIAGDAKRTAETFARDFQLGREISVTRDATGTVRRLSVAVALRNINPKKPRTAAEIVAIENLVKGAVGFDAARGDQVAISARAFADVASSDPSMLDAPWLPSVARNASALLVVLVLLIGIGRPLMKRRAAARVQAETTVSERRLGLGQDIAAAISADQLAHPDRPVSLEMISSAPSYQARAQLVRQFVKQNPDHAALVVRDLLASEGARA